MDARRVDVTRRDEVSDAPSPCPLHLRRRCLQLQQLQVPRDLVYHALRRRPNAQHRCAPACNLCPPCVVDDVRRQSEAQRLRLQQLELLLALDLQRHLGLAQPLPASQHGRVGRGAEEVLVAGQRRVSALCADFACELSEGFSEKVMRCSAPYPWSCPDPSALPAPACTPRCCP
jgi:hypothetical protein